MDEILTRSLNSIATYLSEGEMWHRKVANELRKLPNRRGFAVWHETESKYDQCEHLKLDKLFRDKLKYSASIDMNYVERAAGYSVANTADFKKHFKDWTARETAFLEAVNTAIPLISKEDMEIYHCLCSLAKEVKNEAMRAEWVLLGFEDTAWEPHDIRVVSYLLHDYFECHYNGGIIDFNIG